MKLGLTLIILGATWYFAGMHRRSPMMTVILCGLMLLVLLLIFPLILKRKLNPRIIPQKKYIYKNSEACITIHTDNKSRLPVNKFTYFMKMGYKGGMLKRKKFSGCVSGRDKDDENDSSFWFFPPYSGMIRLELTKIKVFDYLQLVSSGRKLKDISAEIEILPFPKDMEIIFPPFGEYSDKKVSDTSSDVSGEDLSEIRYVREYQPGDLSRHLHRNYSARTQKLWIKEYQRENDYIFDMLIDSSSPQKLTLPQADAFYELVCSVLNSLLRDNVVIHAYWYDGNFGGMNHFRLSRKSQVGEMMLQMIHSDMDVRPDIFAAVAGDTGKSGMTLNSRLEWYFKDQLVFRFDENEIEQQLKSRPFEIGGDALSESQR